MSKTNKIEIILNYHAGNGHAKSACRKVTNFLDSINLNYEVHTTRSDGDGIRIAKELANQQLSNVKIVVIGGDGTLNQCVNGVKQSNFPNTPLGYIPGGSGNDFSRGIKLKIKDPVRLIQAILSMEQPRTIDIGQATGPNFSHYFINNIGIGFDASTVYYTNHSARKEFLNKLRLGTLSYLTNLFKAITRQPAFKLDVDYAAQQKHFDSAYIVVATNHPYFGGGFAVDPTANPFNHHLNLVVVKKITGLTFAKLLTKLLTDGSHLQDKNVWHIERTDFTLQSSPKQFGQMDGEELSKHNFDLHFQVNQHLFWLPVNED